MGVSFTIELHMEFDWNSPPFKVNGSLTFRDIEESFEDPFAVVNLTIAAGTDYQPGTPNSASVYIIDGQAVTPDDVTVGLVTFTPEALEAGVSPATGAASMT